MCEGTLTNKSNHNIGAEIITNAILEFPCYNYNIIMGPQTLFALLRPLYEVPRLLHCVLGVSEASVQKPPPHPRASVFVSR